MAADTYSFRVSALSGGLKIKAATSKTVYYKIVLPSSILGGNGDSVDIDINSSCMESGSSLSIHGTGDFAGANAVTFAYDTTSARIVEWSVG